MKRLVSLLILVYAPLIVSADEGVCRIMESGLEIEDVVVGSGATAKSGQKVKRSFYIFPKHLPNTGANDVGVIGGTFIEGAHDDTRNEEEFEILVEGAKKFYGIK